jgi:DNA-directed RNA polymerase specialized sigma24 family protein
MARVAPIGLLYRSGSGRLRSATGDSIIAGMPLHDNSAVGPAAVPPTVSLTARLEAFRAAASAYKDEFVKVFIEHQHTLEKIAAAKFGRGRYSDVSDVLQAVFVKGWENLHQLQGKPVAWLVQITKNEVTDRQRVMQRGPGSIDGLDVPGPPPEINEPDDARVMQVLSDLVRVVREHLLPALDPAVMATHRTTKSGRPTKAEAFVEAVHQLKESATVLTEYLDAQPEARPYGRPRRPGQKG